MIKIPHPIDDADKKDAEKPAKPMYREIASRLADLIRNRQLPNGLVILESPLAEYFGVSRVPVRAALEELQKSGLLRRYRGRGLLVDPDGVGAPPLRVNFLTLAPVRDEQTEIVLRTFAWEPIAQKLNEVIAKFLPFGAYQISEADLCSEFKVSRTVARESLHYLRARGLVEKTAQAGWTFGPITAHTIVEQYEMRIILEPEALVRAAARVPKEHFENTMDKVARIMSREIPATMSAFEWLERNLHGEVLSHCPNENLYATILENQLPLGINQAFRRICGINPDDPAFAEHMEVLGHLVNGESDEAARALKVHLRKAQSRLISRLKVMAVLAEPKPPSYLHRLATGEL